jgi:hypothetical protein
VSRRCTPRNGITTESSWSWPTADWPLAASSPITSHENCLIRICAPTGLSLPKSWCRTVSPITHTAAPLRSSDSLK